LLGFISDCLEYARSHKFRRIVSVLEPLPSEFGIPATETYGEIMLGLDKIADRDLERLPAEMASGICEVRRHLHELLEPKS